MNGWAGNACHDNTSITFNSGITAMARKSTIGTNPLDAVIPKMATKKTTPALKKRAKPVDVEPPPSKERLTIQINVETVERARNASYWERIPLAQIVDEAINAAIDKLERSRGETYAERDDALRAGRPFKRR